MLKLVCAIVSKILVVMIKVALIHYLEIGPNTASFFYFHFTLSSQINDKQKSQRKRGRDWPIYFKNNSNH